MQAQDLLTIEGIVRSVGDRTRLALALMLLVLVTIMVAGGLEEQSRVIVPAKEILSRISRDEPVDFDFITITGDLNLSELDLPSKLVARSDGSFQPFQIVRSPIRILDSRIDGNVDFTRAILESSISFHRTYFNSSVDFSSSKFNSSVDFVGAEFNSSAAFWSSSFNGPASFGYSSFNGPVDFGYSSLKGFANFMHSSFYGDSNFGYSSFNDLAIFDESKFDKLINFRRSLFGKGLSLKNLDFVEIYLEWNAINNIYRNFDGKVYLSLIESYKARGFYSDADNCYYAFRKEQFFNRRITDDPLMYLFDLGGWIFYGYGKRPLFPLGWSVGSILLFGAIWRIGKLRTHKDAGQRGIFEKYRSNMGDIRQRQPQNRNLRSELRILAEDMAFSAAVFLSGTKLFVDPPEISESLRWSRSFVKGMFTFERILGAFFSILLFLAISGTVVR